MRQREILRHTKNFQSSGIIHHALIPFFDQNGHWVGDKIRWAYRTYVAALEAMKGAFLPAARRTSRCLAGTNLLTSFLWREATPAYIPFSEVSGSVLVPSKAIIRAPSLRAIGIHFLTHSNNAILLPNLIRVGGYFDAEHSCNLNAPRLRAIGGDCRLLCNSPPSLEEVGGTFCVKWAFSFSSARLSIVGGSLGLHKSTHIDLPELRSVGLHLVASDLAKRILVPKLEHVGGDLFASGANFISARRLRSVGGRIDSTSAPDFYRPSIVCGGEWYMYPDDMERWELRMRARIALRGDQGPLSLWDME